MVARPRRCYADAVARIAYGFPTPQLFGEAAKAGSRVAVGGCDDDDE